MVMCVVCFVCFFFFKQKTAYEMRISDWSSDVCSSDLLRSSGETTNEDQHRGGLHARRGAPRDGASRSDAASRQICRDDGRYDGSGRASRTDRTDDAKLGADGRGGDDLLAANVRGA